jgi:plastocyanin
MTRRRFLAGGGLALAGLAAPWRARPEGLVEIRMRSDPRGEEVWFDPIGVLIEPGQTVRWIVSENVHTTTAYHPKNAHHSLRIPEGAAPWDSGFLINPGDHFEVRLTVEGIYDYFCQPHELAGMVGRLIVGKPTGPGALAFDYFEGHPEAADWLPVPEAARRAFPQIDRIVREGVIRRG